MGASDLYLIVDYDLKVICKRVGVYILWLAFMIMC